MSGDQGTVRVYHTGEDRNPYPWRFEIEYQGRTYYFAGTPNQCDTKRKAAARAAWRRRWLLSGEFDKRYRLPVTFTPSLDANHG